jgi:hypothetical protein
MQEPELRFNVSIVADEFETIQATTGEARTTAEDAFTAKTFRFEQTHPGRFNLVLVEDRILRQPKPTKAPRKPTQGTPPTAAPKKIAIRLA